MRGPARFARAHWFRHPEEDHDTLSAAPGWERFVGNAQAAINLLPIVHDPNVARWADGKIGLHLQTSANVAAGGRNPGHPSSSLAGKFLCGRAALADRCAVSIARRGSRNQMTTSSEVRFWSKADVVSFCNGRGWPERICGFLFFNSSCLQT